MKISLDTGVVTEMAKLITGRKYFAISSIGHKIYVLGGLYCFTCESFDVFSNFWSEIPSLPG